ncbi:hypothetical protein H5U35_01625, partial [Candidatus Aerophobetes bacterium]|nr:hypothetical protein [Candidatus Aerophobetes bacterium]
LEKILLIRNLTSWKLFILIVFISFLLTFLVGQVAAVIFVTSLVFEICGFFGINPLPFIMITLMSVNIGSAGSLLGSPAGILLATGVGLRFEDFLIWSFPVALSSLLAGSLFLFIWYRDELKRTEGLIRRMKGILEDRSFRQLVNFPATREIKEEIFLLGVVFTLLALHFQIEEFFSLPHNTLLVAVPLIGAGIAMGWKKEEARRYIEEHVDWWTVVFFILFFAKAGAFSYTGITSLISSFIQEQAKLHPLLLITEITWISSFASSIMDNVVVVSILMPAIKAIANEKFLFQLVDFLWWGLFLGGCFGSIMTMIGSPANIVALGMLEKHEKIKVGLFEWVKVGILLTLLTTSVATLELIVFSLFC